MATDCPRLTTLAIASPVLILLLTACGGGSGSGSGPAAAPHSSNQAPIASFTSSTLAGVEPLRVSFDASASRDPDGTIRSYTWYPYGSSGFSAELATSTYGPVIYEAGEYTVVLKVTDQAGSTAQTTVRIVVAPGPRGDVELRYRDRYGVPITGLMVGFASDSGPRTHATTGADGTALLGNVLAGPGCAGISDGWDGFDACGKVTVLANQRTVLDLPYEYPAGPGGLVRTTSARIVDANTLDLESEVYVFNPNVELAARAPPLEAGISLAQEGREVHSAPSEADTTFEYAIDPSTPVQIDAVAGDLAPTAHHAGVLVDVSGSKPPTAATLYAIKEFLRSSTAAEGLVLAAFAGSALGSPALLPAQPVTLFPRDNPGFAAHSSALFAEVDSLRALGGGTRPLYDAVDSMLDFLATNTPSGKRRALVVVAGDEDTTCGSTVACRSRLQATMARTLAAGVDLYYVSDQCCSALPNSAALGQASRGGIAWLSAGHTTMRHLGAIQDGTAPRYRVRLRLKAAAPGAFQPGRVLNGTYAATVPQAAAGTRFVLLPFAIVL